MFRVRSCVLGAAAVLKLQSATCDGFDSQGFEPKMKNPMAPGAPSLSLSGVGMRRKNFYVVNVDVYWTGLHLAPAALAAAQSCVAKGTDACDLAADVGAAFQASDTNAGSSAVVSLKFVRSVGKNDVVEAFTEAFKGLPDSEVGQFKEALAKAVGEKGMLVNDTVKFCWLQGGGLVVLKNEDEGVCVKVPALEKRLLEVYLDAKRTVSPDLLSCINTHIQGVEA